MQNNWSKAIQFALATLAANIVGVVVSFKLDSLLPMVGVVLSCAVVSGYFIFGNAIREYRLNRLDRQTGI